MLVNQVDVKMLNIPTAAEITKEATEKLKSTKLKSYDKYDFEYVKKILSDAAEKEVKLTKDILEIMKRNQAGFICDIEGILDSKTAERIKKSFQTETFKMSLNVKPDGGMHVELRKNGNPFWKTINLTRADSGNEAGFTQAISILMEIGFLILDICGIDVEINEQRMAEIAEELLPVVRGNAFRRALDALAAAWSRGDANVMSRATAIFWFLYDSFVGGFFWTLMNALLADLSWFDYMKAAAVLTVTVVAAFATDGLALIARIALALYNMTTLGVKLANFNEICVRERSLSFVNK